MNGFKEKALIYRKELILGFILFIVSTLSFALGYAANKQNHAPIVIEDCKNP